jgi:hypothetical protein
LGFSPVTTTIPNNNPTTPMAQHSVVPVIFRQESILKETLTDNNQDADEAAFKEKEERALLFEGWMSAGACAVLMGVFMLILVGPAWIYAEHPIEWIMAFMWHVSLWILPHFTVHRPKTHWNNLLFVICVSTLALQPHMDICRRVPHLGACHGAASCMVIIRAFEFYTNQNAFKNWRRWRRTVFISAWGWHDARDAKYVGPGKWQPEFIRMAIWSSRMFACAAFLFFWGKPPYRTQPLVFNQDTTWYFFVRWAVGFWLLLSWFNSMDSFARTLHLWADGHELRHISEDPWGARTLKDFWGRRWNVPVQDLLMKGVFVPIRGLRWLPGRKLIAKLMVFVASGLCHTYAISCGGLPWTHLTAMFLFFMVQIPLIYLEDVFNFQGLGWMLAAELPFAPLFIESCLTFVHL